MEAEQRKSVRTTQTSRSAAAESRPWPAGVGDMVWLRAGEQDWTQAQRYRVNQHIKAQRQQFSRRGPNVYERAIELVTHDTDKLRRDGTRHGVLARWNGINADPVPEAEWDRVRRELPKREVARRHDQANGTGVAL